jgi:hypothetical protein
MVEAQLTGRQIKEKLVNGFLEELKNIKINELPLFQQVTKKHCLVSPNIELTDLNAFLMSKGNTKVDSFIEFLTELYVTSTTRLIQKSLPYPANEKVKTLPVLSFTPGEKNPKFIQFSF